MLVPACAAFVSFRKAELAEKKKELRVQKANATKASNKNKTLEAEIQRLTRSVRRLLNRSAE